MIQVNSDNHSHTRNMFRFAAGCMDSLPSTLRNQESEVCKSWMCSGSRPALGRPAAGGCVGSGGASTRTVVMGLGAKRHQESLGRLHGREREMGPSFVLRRAGGAHSRWCERNRERWSVAGQLVKPSTLQSRAEEVKEEQA